MENKPKENPEPISMEKDEIMSRVNSTFDKIAQDVKNMINENKQQDNAELL